MTPASTTTRSGRPFVAAVVAGVIASMLLAACAPQAVRDPLAGLATPAPAAAARAATPRIDPAVAARILTIDPERVTERDVRETLVHGPTPQIVLLHGGVFPVHLVMVSFGRFLMGMGYPEAKVRQPDRSFSISPYTDSTKVAGMLAWYYEHDGVRPMLVGHSQGGMLAVKLLHELNGEYGSDIAVWNPQSDEAEARTTIVDPLTGATRPVVGVSVASTLVVGAGGPSALLPNQWRVISRLRDIPDTTAEFVGYIIEVDLFAWTFSPAAADHFQARGQAKVRNVVLPGWYMHVTLPVTHHLADDPAMRDWLYAYSPGAEERRPPPFDSAADSALWAADVWYTIRKHWALEAQRAVRAQAGREAGR